MFKISSDKDVPLIKMESRDDPAYCQTIDEEPDGKPWYHDIKHYTKIRNIPKMPHKMIFF